MNPPDESYVVLGSVHLGSGEEGEERKAALESMANHADCTWGGRPSIGRWLIAMADFFRKHQRPPDAHELSCNK